MKTELINIDKVPSENELVSLLGLDLNKYYNILNKSINLLLRPDLEIWDNAGRRGKYFHGYRINSSNMLVDIYLSSIHGEGKLNCEFKFQKKTLSKIQKEKNNFSKQTQVAIDSATKAMENYGGFYLNLMIDEKSMIDTLYLLTIVS